MEAYLGGSASGKAVVIGERAPHLLSLLYIPELEIRQKAPTTGETKAQHLRMYITVLSMMGLVRIPGFANSVTLPHPTRRIPLSLNLHKGLWSQNQLASSSSTSGKPFTVCMNPVIWSLCWGGGCRSPA